MTLDNALAWLTAREKHPKRVASERGHSPVFWRWSLDDPIFGRDSIHDLPSPVWRRLRRSGHPKMDWLYTSYWAAMRAAASAVVDAEAAGWVPPRDAIEVV